MKLKQKPKKAKEKQLLQKALEVEDIHLLERHNKRYTSLADYDNLKQIAKQLGVKPEFLIIDKEQLAKLNEEKDRFVVLPTKDGKIRLAFLPQNKEYIFNLLYPEKKQNKEDVFSVNRNSKVNTRLKSEVLLGGQKMCYRTLTKNQVEQLYSEQDTKELFAAFNKNTQDYNVAFKDCDEEKIDIVLSGKNTVKRQR
ncbi:MAG: hypothetical protein ACI4GV_03485 [Acutalibacteraceae bacterium]